MAGRTAQGGHAGDGRRGGRMKKPLPHHTEGHRITQDFTARISGIKSVLPTVCFFVELAESLAKHLPAADVPCALAGGWQKRPPSDSADAVLWKLAALLKFDPATRFVERDEFGPLVCWVAEYLKIDDDDAWQLFSTAYAKAKTGTGAANQLLQVAKNNAHDDIERGDDREYVGRRPVSRVFERRLLVGIFYYLLRGGKPGERFLSTRDAGKLIGVHESTAATWIRAMVRDGYLERLPDDTRKGLRVPQWLRTPLYRWIDC